VSATIGVASLALGGALPRADLGLVWLTWWLGDAGGCLVVAPLLILWTDGSGRRWTRAQVLEAIALLLCLVGVGQLVFGSVLPWRLRFPLQFLCIPLLIWAAYRFDSRTAATAMLVLAALAVGWTLGVGRTVERKLLNEALVMLPVFLGVSAVTTLALSALAAEQRLREEAIRSTSERLREAMTDLEAFGHSISHDLRSPIGAMLNYATIIEQDYGDRLESEGVRLLGRIRASGEAAVHLLDQLVRFVWVQREGEPRETV